MNLNPSETTINPEVLLSSNTIDPEVLHSSTNPYQENSPSSTTLNPGTLSASTTQNTEGLVSSTTPQVKPTLAIEKMDNDKILDDAPVQSRWPAYMLRAKAAGVIHPGTEVGAPIRVQFVYPKIFGGYIHEGLPDFIVSMDQITKLADLKEVVSRDHVIQELEKFNPKLDLHHIHKVVLYLYGDGMWIGYDLALLWNEREYQPLWATLLDHDIDFEWINPAIRPTFRIIMKVPDPPASSADCLNKPAGIFESIETG